jgi:hypothetical protein
LKEASAPNRVLSRKHLEHEDNKGDNETDEVSFPEESLLCSQTLTGTSLLFDRSRDLSILLLDKIVFDGKFAVVSQRRDTFLVPEF